MGAIHLKAKVVTTVFFNRQKFFGKIMCLIVMVLAALVLSGAPASAFDSSFPDNTIYVVYEFESGFHGGSPGAWGANDQLFIVKETFTFMANGTFNDTYSNDDSLTRLIGDDGSGGNTFTTTYSPDSGSETGTYRVSADGVVTLTFTGPDPEVISGVLSENGQTIIFGYGEYDDSESYASFGIGVGVKKGSGFSSALPDNTIYTINSFASGFHGGSPGAWGANDELSIVKEVLTFMADGTFSGTFIFEDSLNRLIGADGSGGNTFTTTYQTESGGENGTYTISSDGVVTLTFPPPDSEVVSGVLSEDGQTMIFAFGEYDDSESYASFEISVGVKKGTGFSSAFPNNTTYLVNEFESGFHGGVPGAWGANDQLFVVKTTLSFMSNGTFTGTFSNDDSLNRFIGADGSGGNTFTTTYDPDSGSDSGTYTVSSDGVVTLTFTGPESEVITGMLSADGQTIIFGYREYEDNNSYGSFGIGVGVKRPAQEIAFPSTGLLLLLDQ